MAKTATLKIPAIHCGGCVSTVKRTIEALPSVEVAESDPATKMVRVDFDESAVTLDQIRDALDQVGFSPDD